MKKTYQPKAKEVSRETHTLDAKGEVLGRFSTKVATLLMGKHKADYSNHMDMGDKVIIKNAEKIVLTGKKLKQKTYKSHSGFPGGFKEVRLDKMLAEQPKKVIEKAVAGMLPKNRLQSPRMRRLTVLTSKESN